MSASPIGFAVVGYGRIGRRHAAIIEGHPDCSLRAVCDVRPAEATGWTGSVPYHASLDELLAARPEVQVICICTPNGLHAVQAQRVLRAGYHVVVEKPMALSRSDSEQIIYSALNASRQVFCVMQNRYTPPAAWLKELLTGQRLGRIYLVEINCYWNRDDRYYQIDGLPHPWHGRAGLDGGPLFTQFSHFVDLMYWLFGDITDIRAAFGNHAHQESTDYEDTGTVSFRFVRGGQGMISYSTAAWDQNLESSITILGERGSVKVGGQYMDRVETCHVEGYSMPVLPVSEPPNDYGGYKGSAANHHHVFQNVVDTLRGHKPAATNALEGLKVVDIIERIYAQRSDHTRTT